MVTTADLQAQLRAHPDDWPSWLVYADWLTDEGDGRGEMIVLEHQLARGQLGPKARTEARHRLVTLQAVHQPAKLPEWACPEGTALAWRCGFVIGVRFPREPGWLVALERLVAHPSGAMLGSLGLSDHAMGTEGLERLLASPALPHLFRLNLWGNRLDVQAAALLARDPRLRSLLSLSLWNNRLGDDGAALLAEEGSLPSLLELDLGDNRIGPNGALALARASGLRSLRVLRLARNAVGEGAQALARSTALGSLAELDVSGNALHPRVTEQILQGAPPGRRVHVV